MILRQIHGSRELADTWQLIEDREFNAALDRLEALDMVLRRNERRMIRRSLRQL